MKLDTRLQAAADETRDQLRGLTPPPLRSSNRRLAAVAGIAVAAALVVTVIVWSGISPLSRPAAEGIYLAPGEILLAEDPTVVQGAPAVEARFDTAELGEEAPLGTVTDVAGLVSRIGEIHEGDVFRITVIGITGDGATAALVLTDTANGVDPSGRVLRLLCIWIDEISACGGAPAESLAGQSGGFPGGELAPSLALSFDHPGPSELGWGSLPEGTSVVVLGVNGISRWQLPVGGVAVFDTDLLDGDEFVMTALDADGNTIVRQSLVAGG